MAITVNKSAKASIPYLTGYETQILLAQPDSSSYGGYRDMVLLSVLYDTAARVQELVDIKSKGCSFNRSSDYHSAWKRKQDTTGCYRIEKIAILAIFRNLKSQVL